jgi:hypothetical protein
VLQQLLHGDETLAELAREHRRRVCDGGVLNGICRNRMLLLNVSKL